jgi:hypothetical protein
MVYSYRGLGSWTKDFDLFYHIFFEQWKILTPAQGFIYRHLTSLSNRGLAISIKEYSQQIGFRHNKFIDHLDALQDAKLLYRVCRVDTQGKPNDLVLHTPPTLEKWLSTEKDNLSYGEVIIKRVTEHRTREERREMGKAWPGEDRRFSQRRINACFDGDGARAEDFTLLVLDVLFRMQSYKRDKREEFEGALRHAAQGQRPPIYMTDQLWAAAFEIKHRYAPQLF